MAVNNGAGASIGALNCEWVKEEHTQIHNPKLNSGKCTLNFKTSEIVT